MTDKYPLAADVIMSDVYMDDLLTGADDLESGRKLQEQLVSLLKGAGMELHKWSASNPLLLPDSMCRDKDLSYSSSTETLGLLWKPHPDSFAFKISPMTSNCASLIVTKKSVISTIARIFDPLGLIGPVMTRDQKSKELSESLKCIVKNIQRTSFSNEIQYLEKEIPLPNSCKLLNFHPFLDDGGLLRNGGRLRNSSIPRNQKYPMIIPTNHNFTYIVINHFHILYFHTGAEATLANIRIVFGYHPQGMYS
ncbi:integrase catalytic domain-containing protein [Trichonephila clavata]|uniref:Integrase catalytic domain-containing protein n=1 Tax=Trichonephila clavata TaxID=2740835 RepID=A0A8X6HNL2_TRICU|nr:integrase catalytic domain-containing protein [Trichonephila clavata]